MGQQAYTVVTCIMTDQLNCNGACVVLGAYENSCRDVG